jgi:hypothetical protein
MRTMTLVTGRTDSAFSYASSSGASVTMTEALSPTAACRLRPISDSRWPFVGYILDRMAADTERALAMSEYEWVRPSKMREFHVDPLFGDVHEAERQLYLAVIRGDVRARLNGRVLGPEWLKQVGSMKDPSGPFVLPPDLELSVEDAKRLWG